MSNAARKKEMGSRLKKIRKALLIDGANPSQTAFGREIGLTGTDKEVQSKISKWESGRIGVPHDVIEKYADFGDVTIDFVITRI